MNLFAKIYNLSIVARFRRALLSILLGNSQGRRFLAFLVTVYARRRTGEDVKVYFDGVWGHSFAGICVPDSRKFCYHEEAIDRWTQEVAKWKRAAEEFWCVKYKPQPGDVIIDVGAGIGTDAFYFSPILGEKGKIIAIEANPNTYALLTKMCEWNGLRNVTCRQCAIVDSPKDVLLEDGDYHEANSIAFISSESCGSVLVPGQSLDYLVEKEGLSRIDFIKMNIEGAETLALEGMKQALMLTRHVCIACHDFRADCGEGEGFRTRKQVERTLCDLGFRLLPVDSKRRPAIRDHVHGFRAS